MIKRTQEQALLEAEDHGFILLSKFEGVDKPATFKCSCGKEFTVRYRNILRSDAYRHGTCGHCEDPCVGDKFGSLTVTKVKTNKKGNGCRVNVKCDCGNKIMNIGANKLRKMRSCGCVKSHGERTVFRLLSLYNIDFEIEKQFTGLSGIGNGGLRFDFYLPAYNICIEYQGKQHYSEKDSFGGKESFDRLREHDRIKEKYCANNGIKLIKIPYTKDEQQIEIIIREIALPKIGTKFGNLTVCGSIPTKDWSSRDAVCDCVCGKKVVITPMHMLLRNQIMCCGRCEA